MKGMAPMVPYPVAVNTKNSYYRRLTAAVLFVLLAAAVSEERPGAQVTTTDSWTAADIGSPAIRGAAKSFSCTVATGCPLFTVTAAGDGVAGKADRFTFLYQRLTGDGVIKMRVLSVAGTTNAETGLMFRETLKAGSRHGSFMAGPSLALRRRATAGGASAQTLSARPPGIHWLKLERSGSTFRASVSTDGSEWTVTGTQTVSMPASVYVGIVATSREAAQAATATVSGMAVESTAPSLPEGWSSADIGRTKKAGAAAYAGSTFEAVSSALGIRGDADAFRFVYYRTRGDLKLITRVPVLKGRSGGQAGITLRNTLEPGSIQSTLLVDDVGVAFVKRTANGAAAAAKRSVKRVAPVWLRLERQGSMVTTSYSTDGKAWKPVSTDTVALAEELYVGLAVSGGKSEVAAAAAFDKVSLVSVAANQPPVVSLVTPEIGAIYAPGAAVLLTAEASDPDDRVARVEFRVNGALVATDTSAPFTATWKAGPKGLYYLTSVAIDDDGASTTSTQVPVMTLSVIDNPPDNPDDPDNPDNPDDPDDPDDPEDPPPPDTPPGNGPYRLVFEASFDHAMIDYYVLNIQKAGTKTVVYTRNIGKPTAAANREITVDVDAAVKALAAGEYEVIVQAVEGSDRADSAPFYMLR